LSRKIAVLTVGRSDFSRYLPVLRGLDREPGVDLRLLATGGHFSPVYGETWREIVAAGFSFEPGLESTLACDTPVGVGKGIGVATMALAQSFARDRPDLLVLLGDRYEMLAGANAALGFSLPMVHIHGGAVTEGAIDELVRHALTKMSHYHLVSTEAYARRVRQMGEEAWRVEVVGAPGLDDLTNLASLSRAELAAQTGLDLDAGFLLLSYHPVTLELGQTRAQIAALLDVVAASPLPCVITYPNADPGSQDVIAALKTHAAAFPKRTHVFANAGGRVYTSLMAQATVMIGNSSSGLVEAPSFRLPVVNIGTRQDGKIKAANVIDCGYAATDIAAALERAASSAFRDSLRRLINPYGDGHAGLRIAGILAALPLDDRLLRKRFADQ
jgi:UDP-N-acetylglucosamine 2-epimerase (non-hydrolysing)